MPNQLKDSPSPYLQRHADNPVDWHPWSLETLEKAKAEKKPIFLSIGYSACHWCHVMERESFRHQETADILNRLYIPVKVDREERPELDGIYLKALMLIMGGAGWPMNVWLTPRLKPFHGGIYIPHEPRPGAPSLAQQLLFLGDAWQKKRQDVEASARRVTAMLKQMSQVDTTPLKEAQDWLTAATENCRAQLDDKHGGFGQGAKFPQAQALRFLLARAVTTEDDGLLKQVDKSAQSMGRGGLFDQLGGGFHRYCVDPEWTVPHFEKMLGDNALLCSLYAELYHQTKTPFYKWIVDSLVLWLERDMTLEQGGFCSSTDAESQEEEGRAFVWTPEQVSQAMESEEAKIFKEFYAVAQEGNFREQSSVLTQRRSLPKCAKALGWEGDKASQVLQSAREKALQARSDRPQPKRDHKVVANWNAQMVSGLCLAHQLADTPQALELAKRCGEFLVKELLSRKDESQPYPRVWSQSESYGKALSEDLGALSIAFFDLHETDGDPKWLEQANSLVKELVDNYWDPEARMAAQTHPSVDDLLYRPYVFEDNSTPSGNSLFLEALRRQLKHSPENAEILDEGLAKLAPLAPQAATSFGTLLMCAQRRGS